MHLFPAQEVISLEEQAAAGSTDFRRLYYMPAQADGYCPFAVDHAASHRKSLFCAELLGTACLHHALNRLALPKLSRVHQYCCM